MSLVDDLRELAQLHESGALSTDEYAVAKQRLLDGGLSKQDLSEMVDGRKCAKCGIWTLGEAPCHACGAGVPTVAMDDLKSALDQAADMARPVRVRGGWIWEGSVPRTIAAALTGLIFGALALSELAAFVVVAALALLALVPAKIAESHGHRLLTWYLYGLWLLPVAVGHALVLDRRDPDRWLKALGGVAATLVIGFLIAVVAAA